MQMRNIDHGSYHRRKNKRYGSLNTIPTTTTTTTNNFDKKRKYNSNTIFPLTMSNSSSNSYQKKVSFGDDIIDSDDDSTITFINKDSKGKLELKNLKREYQAKRQALDICYQSDIEAINEQYTEKKTFKCKTFEKNQFNVVDGRSACSSISLLAVYNFLRRKNRDILKIQCTQVIEYGAKLWRCWKNRQLVDKYRMYQGVHEAYKEPSIDKVRKIITISKEIGGHLDNEKLSEFIKPIIPSLDNNNNNNNNNNNDDDDDEEIFSLDSAILL